MKIWKPVMQKYFQQIPRTGFNPAAAQDPGRQAGAGAESQRAEHCRSDQEAGAAGLHRREAVHLQRQGAQVRVHGLVTGSGRRGSRSSARSMRCTRTGVTPTRSPRRRTRRRRRRKKEEEATAAAAESGQHASDASADLPATPLAVHPQPLQPAASGVSLPVPAYVSHHSRDKRRLRAPQVGPFPSQPSKRSLARFAKATIHLCRVFAGYPDSWRLTSAATTLPSALPLVCGVTCAMTLPMPFMPSSAAPVDGDGVGDDRRDLCRVSCCGR